MPDYAACRRWISEAILELRTDQEPEAARLQAEAINKLKPLKEDYDNLGQQLAAKSMEAVTIDPGEEATERTRRVIECFGDLYGCHQCGRKDVVSWQADHLPAKALDGIYLDDGNSVGDAIRNELGIPTDQFRLYWQCLPCSTTQASIIKKIRKTVEEMPNAEKVPMLMRSKQINKGKKTGPSARRDLLAAALAELRPEQLSQILGAPDNTRFVTTSNKQVTRRDREMLAVASPAPLECHSCQSSSYSEFIADHQPPKSFFRSPDVTALLGAILEASLPTLFPICYLAPQCSDDQRKQAGAVKSIFRACGAFLEYLDNSTAGDKRQKIRILSESLSRAM